MKAETPRFYKTVLCNGDYMDATLDHPVFMKKEKTVPEQTGATTTGYYLKKYMNETVSSKLLPMRIKKPHHFITIFRYAEILLNYAEAMDAWKDADYTDNDHPFLSARAGTELYQVRAAAGGICLPLQQAGDAFT